MQAVKAITGGVIALKGQLLKGGAYLIASKTKFITKTGDAFTALGTNIVKNAAHPYAQPPHPGYLYDHPPVVGESFSNFLNFDCLTRVGRFVFCSVILLIKKTRRHLINLTMITCGNVWKLNGAMKRNRSRRRLRGTTARHRRLWRVPWLLSRKLELRFILERWDFSRLVNNL